LAYGAKTLAVLTIEYSGNNSSPLANHSTRHGEDNQNDNKEVIYRQIQQYGPFTDWIQDAQWLYEVGVDIVNLPELSRNASCNLKFD
jgi:hypothetical protein